MGGRYGDVDAYAGGTKATDQPFQNLYKKSYHAGKSGNGRNIEMEFYEVINKR